MPRILVGDDNDDNRDALKRRLERKGFDVFTAAGGKEGVQRTESDSPEVVLMDMNMPELDGWAATKLIRGQGNTVPVIALTAHVMTGDRERAIEAGCTDYHTKPIEMDKLLRLIESPLEQ